MDYTEKKEKIESALGIIWEVDLAEDQRDETPQDYENEEKAQQFIWSVLKTMTYEERQKLADEIYSEDPHNLYLLANRGTEQAFAINTLTRKYLELESMDSKSGSPKVIDLHPKDPFADLPI